MDPRYSMKKEGEIGIYLIDGIILRIAKVINENGNYNTKYVKNLHQEFLSYNVVNNLSISLATEMPTFPRIRVPISCLVKYLGYTVLCHGDSPC